MSFSATGLQATGAVLGTKRTMSETVKTGSFRPHVGKLKIRMSEGESKAQFFTLRTNDKKRIGTNLIHDGYFLYWKKLSFHTK